MSDSGLQDVSVRPLASSQPEPEADLDHAQESLEARAVPEGLEQLLIALRSGQPEPGMALGREQREHPVTDDEHPEEFL